MPGIIESAVNWALTIAQDNNHGYSQDNRWGPDYDCSSFVITAYEQAGVKVKSAGATYTGDMKPVFLQCGFKDVTSSVDLNTGSGLKRGDVLLNIEYHTAMAVTDNGTTIVHASTADGNPQSGDQTGKEICVRQYYLYSNGGWDCVLRYPDTGNTALKPQRETIIEVPEGLGKYYTYMNWDTITNMDTLQGKLIQTAGKHYNNDGYGVIGNRLTLAMTSTFGVIGDYVDVYMADGRVINGIIAEEKSQVYTWYDQNPANKWGHDNGQNIVEFVTNWQNHDNPPGNGGVIKVVNLGNYFEYPEYADGSAIEGYMYSENAYENSEPTVVWNNRIKENIQPRLSGLPIIQPNGKLSLYAENNNITSVAGNLSWQNSIYELSTTLSFETAKSDAAYLKDLIYTPQVGDVVRMVTSEEVFRGIIIKVDDGDKNCNKYSAVDMGWYLNKTSQTYQFNNISATDAIKEICEDLCIPIASLPELSTNLKQIYFDKCISDILTDILSKCSGDYNYDFTPHGLRIYKVGDLIADPQLKIADNIKNAPSVNYIGNMSHSISIEDMKNSIKITSEKDNVYTELMVLQNRDLINKYGFLQSVIKIDAEKDNAETVANSELLYNGREKESFSFEIIEKYDSYTRAGEVIHTNGAHYVIEGTHHSFKNGWHYNKLELRKVY